MDFLDVIGITTIVDNIKEHFEVKKEEEESPPAPVTPMTYSFRPRNLEEFIGQEPAKDKIRLNIDKILNIKPIHLIISGTKGCGKSSLAYIIANMLGFKIHTYIGSEFTKYNLDDFLEENQDADIPQILFCDEIHELGVDRKKFNPTFLYPILEDFIYPAGKNPKLRKFIFIGATTDKEKIELKYSPLLDRCTSIDLDRYNAEDIKKILKQYNSQTYKVELNEMFYDILSVNTRFNPRISLAMFDDFMVCKDMDRVLRAHRIVKNSLTTDDILILRHLEQVGKPVGVETLAVIVQRTTKNYIILIEPFILQQGYISRTSRGRILLSKGRKILEELNEYM